MTVPSTIKNQALVSQKRSLLLRTSAEQFRRKGFERVTIPDIAEAAGMSVGSIYRYIGKKDDLMTLMLQYMQDLVNDQLHIISEQPLPAVEKLERMYEGYVSLILENRDYFIVSIRDFRRMDESSAQQSRNIELQIANMFQRILQSGIDDGEFIACDVKLIASNLVSLGQSWLTRRHLYGRKIAEDFAKAQLDLYESMIVAPH